jgi:hypothetical protein
VLSHSIIDIVQSAQTLLGQDAGQPGFDLPSDAIIELAVCHGRHDSVSILSAGAEPGLTGDI